MFNIRFATEADTSAIKRLADAHTRELGFVLRPALQESIKRQEVMVALDDAGNLAGFIEYHHRRDAQTTLYNLCVASSYRRRSLGSELFSALIDECQDRQKDFILLKCPVDLDANKFYRAIGCKLEEVLERPGKRDLNVWLYHDVSA